MEVSRIAFVWRVMIDIEIGDQPDVAAFVEPSTRKIVILATPNKIMRSMIEQIYMRIASFPIKQLWIRLNELINPGPRNLHEPSGNAESFDAAILANDRAPINAGDQSPHVFFFVALESVCRSHDIARRFNESQQCLRAPR